jgi:dUTP pyrophosphatase
MGDKLLVKVLSDAPFEPPMLKPAREGDVGLDLVVCIAEDELTIPAGGMADISSGLSIKLPYGCWASIRARSSTFAKRQLFVMDGTVDEGFTGALMVFVFNPNRYDVTVKRGDRLAQLVVHQMVPFQIEYVSELPITIRGGKCFGSTDN